MAMASAHLDDLVELLCAKHVSGGAREVTRTVAHSRSPNRLSLSPGKLEHQFTLVLGLWLKDGQRCAFVTEAPVDKRCAGRGSGNRNGIEETVQVSERYVGEGRALVCSHGGRWTELDRRKCFCMAGLTRGFYRFLLMPEVVRRSSRSIAQPVA